MGSKPRALLLVGTVGSGKTTVMLELGRLLGERGEPYALVDLDWLAWVEPPAASLLGIHDILVANLAGAAATFEQAGIRRLVLARHLTRADELAAIRAALGGAELAVVRLDAPHGPARGTHSRPRHGPRARGAPGRAGGRRFARLSAPRRCERRQARGCGGRGRPPCGRVVVGRRT